jgi:hypothetical protein
MLLNGRTPQSHAQASHSYRRQPPTRVPRLDTALNTGSVPPSTLRLGRMTEKVPLNPVKAVQLVVPHVAGFVAATNVTGHRHSGGLQLDRLSVTDGPGLSDLLAACAKAVAGWDWVDDDPEFEDACVDAGIDFEALLRIEGERTAEQEVDRARKELGDLGELLAVLHLLGHHELDPRQVLPKNLLKLYELVSEPGVDVLVFDLDLGDEARDHLAEGEEAIIVECKAGAIPSFSNLARSAGSSIESLDIARWARELKLARANFLERGATAAAKRVKDFVIRFGLGHPSIRAVAVLASNAELEDPAAFGGLDAVAAMRPVRCTAMVLDMSALRGSTFQFRRQE